LDNLPAVPDQRQLIRRHLFNGDENLPSVHVSAYDGKCNAVAEGSQITSLSSKSKSKAVVCVCDSEVKVDEHLKELHDSCSVAKPVNSAQSKSNKSVSSRDGFVKRTKSSSDAIDKHVSGRTVSDRDDVKVEVAKNGRSKSDRRGHCVAAATVISDEFSESDSDVVGSESSNSSCSTVSAISISRRNKLLSLIAIVRKVKFANRSRIDGNLLFLMRRILSNQKVML